MREARLYVADAGVPLPVAYVKDGKFVGLPGHQWRSMGTVDDIDYQFNSSAIHSGQFFDPIGYISTNARSASLTVRCLGLSPRSATLVMTSPQILLVSTDDTEWDYCQNVQATFVVARAQYRIKFDLNGSFRTFQAAAMWQPLGTTMVGSTFTYTYNPMPATPAMYNAGGLIPAGTSWSAATTPRPTGSISDLVPGRLTGYRQWKILAADEHRPIRLGSITANSVWSWTPEVTATCHRAHFVKTLNWSQGPAHGPDEVPYPTCSCGIYARYQPVESTTENQVAGVIEASGRIEIGTEAFRAQRARLVALYPVQAEEVVFSSYEFDLYQPVFRETPDSDRLQALSQTYGVPILSGALEAVKKYPPSDVSALLDEPTPEPARLAHCPQCVRVRTAGPSGIYYCPPCGLNFTDH